MAENGMIVALNRCRDERDEARAENERLREALEDALKHWLLGVEQDWLDYHSARERARAALAQPQTEEKP